MPVLPGLKRTKQNLDLWKSDNKLFWLTNEDILDGTVREWSFSMKFVDRLLKQLEPKCVSHAMSVLQRLGAWCSRDVFELCNVSCNNVREHEAWCREIFEMYMQRKEHRGLVPLPVMVVNWSVMNYLLSSARKGLLRRGWRGQRWRATFVRVWWKGKIETERHFRNCVIRNGCRIIRSRVYWTHAVERRWLLWTHGLEYSG